MFHHAASWLRHAGWKEWHVLQVKSDLPVRADNSMLWWIFRPRGDTPLIIGKFCDDALAIERAARECDILALLRPCAGELGIPELLFRHRATNYFLQLQSIVPGVRLQGNLPLQDPNALANQLNLIEPWLERFHALAPAPGNLAEAVNDLRITASGFAPAALLAALESALPRLQGVPCVGVHGDFWAHNLLVSEGRISVVDWSTFHAGAILEDLFTFSTAAVYHQDRSMDEAVDRFWEALYGSSAHAVSAGGAARRILARRQVGPELLHPFFMIFLVRRLMSTEFLDNGAWNKFALRYLESGMPTPWTGISGPTVAVS